MQSTKMSIAKKRESLFGYEILQILPLKDLISIIYGYIEPFAIIDGKTHFESHHSKEILSKAKTAFFHYGFKIPDGTKMPKMEKIGGHAYLPSNCKKMFEFLKIQNCNLSNFDTSSVTDMVRMFHYASAFNSDISNWDVSSVTDMFSMFQNAKSFNAKINAPWYRQIAI